MSRRPLLITFLSLLFVPSLAGCDLLANQSSNVPHEEVPFDGSGSGASEGGGQKPGGEETPPTTDPDKYKIDAPDFSFAQRNSIEEVTFDDLFNLHNKVEITIDVDRSEMEKINDDNVYGGDFDSIKPETYHLAKKFTLVLHNGEKEFKWELENVGIRQKGNTSRRPIFKEGEIYNNSKQLT